MNISFENIYIPKNSQNSLVSFKKKTKKFFEKTKFMSKLPYFVDGKACQQQVLDPTQSLSQPRLFYIHTRQWDESCGQCQGTTGS